ncbi:hypothetical protein GF352_04515 [archaeon]|nr:hypothetical protein [archaeon]
MKKRVLILICILALTLPAVIAQFTVDDLRAVLRAQSQLDAVKSQLNDVLSNVPQQAIDLIGTNRVYHVRIGDSSLEVVLQNGQITTLKTGAPDNPTHILYVSYGTIMDLVESEDQASAALNALLQGEIVITRANQCSEDSACADNQVCDQGQCKDAYTIAVVPIAYGAGEFQDFYDKAEPEMELFKEHVPMSTGLLRIHYVNTSVCPDMECTDVCRDCQSTAAECARRAGLLGVADKVAGVSKDDVRVYINGQPMLLCGCAGGIPSYTSVSRSRLYVEQGVYCYMTVPHEMGHQLGLYHVDATGEEAGACIGPNAADCNEPDKASDIMGYSWPQDHYGPAATSYLRTSVLGDYQ